MKVSMNFSFDETYGNIEPLRDNVFPTTTAEALEHSIEKYTQMLAWVKEHTEDMLAFPSTASCALCVLFYDRTNPDEEESDEDNMCWGCPVRNKTGLPNCQNTPWQDLRDNLRPTDGEQHDTRVQAVQAELDFLISLRKVKNG